MPKAERVIGDGAAGWEPGARCGPASESCFPGGTVETLNTGWHARVLAFDTGPFELGRVTPQSFP